MEMKNGNEVLGILYYKYVGYVDDKITINLLKESYKLSQILKDSMYDEIIKICHKDLYERGATSYNILYSALTQYHTRLFYKDYVLVIINLSTVLIFTKYYPPKPEYAYQNPRVGSAKDGETIFVPERLFLNPDKWTDKLKVNLLGADEFDYYTCKGVKSIFDMGNEIIEGLGLMSKEEEIKVDAVSRAAQIILGGMIKAYQGDYPYYVKDNFDGAFEAEDSIFITDDEIIERIKHILSDKYRLDIIPVQREFISEQKGKNFFYEDLELKLVEVNE